MLSALSITPATNFAFRNSDRQLGQMPAWIAALASHMAPSQCSFTAKQMNDSSCREVVSSILHPKCQAKEIMTPMDLMQASLKAPMIAEMPSGEQESAVPLDSIETDSASLSTLPFSGSQIPPTIHEELENSLPLMQASLKQPIISNEQDPAILPIAKASTSSITLASELEPISPLIHEELTNSLPITVRTPRLRPSLIYRRSEDSERSTMSMIYELIRLAIKHEENDRSFRHLQQSYMIIHLEKAADNLISQSKMMLTASIVGGCLGILGGFAIIISPLKGKAILNRISKWSWFANFKDAKPDKVFGGLSRALHSASEMTQLTGKSQATQCEGDKARLDGQARVWDIHQQESTRSLETRQRRLEFFLSMYERMMDRLYQFFQSLFR